MIPFPTIREIEGLTKSLPPYMHIMLYGQSGLNKEPSWQSSAESEFTWGEFLLMMFGHWLHNRKGHSLSESQQLLVVKHVLDHIKIAGDSFAEEEDEDQLEANIVGFLDDKYLTYQLGTTNDDCFDILTGKVVEGIAMMPLEVHSLDLRAMFIRARQHLMKMREDDGALKAAVHEAHGATAHAN